MSKGIDQLKHWAMHNVRLISILPSNKNLPVDTRLLDLIEDEVDEKHYLSGEKAEKLIAMIDEKYKVKERVVVDGTLNEPGVIEVMNTVISRYDAGVSNYKTTGGMVIEPKKDIKESTEKVYYAKDNIVVSEEVFFENPFENAYEYIEPEFRQIGEYYLIVNQDGTQAEVLIKLKQGVYETVRVIHDPDEIVRLELITAKDGMGRMGEQAIETFISNSCEPGDTINSYNRTVDKSGISPTLTTRPEGFKTAILPITSDLRIRKLTPLECWRLQGFTDLQFYKAKNEGVSNSQLYKQAGNSVTVNVIDAIIKNLK